MTVWAVVVGALIVSALLTTDPDPSASVIAWAVSVALVAGVGVFAVSSVRRGLAIREVRRMHPDGLVFLARRQPSLVSDLEAYLGSSAIAAAVADRWMVALADGRGISVWTIGGDSYELLLMPWADLGRVEVTSLETGRPGVEIEVKPFDTPLIVAAGYSSYGIHDALDTAGVAEVVERTNRFRA